MKQSHPPGNYTTVPLMENELQTTLTGFANGLQYKPGKSNTVELPTIRINWDGLQSGFAEIPDN